MKEIVVPNDMARALGVTGLQFRNWLRAEAAAGHPLLASHEHQARWKFTAEGAEQLMDEFRQSRTPRRRIGRVGATPQGRKPPVKPLRMSPDAGHRVLESWMGEEVETLADLLRDELRGVVVGINPSPVSVAAGHYYQGRVGQAFFRRLEQAGVLAPGDEFEDDRAFASGLGFTDVVKRPTPRADDLRSGELEHGRELLEAKLRRLWVPRVIFTFKKSAVSLIGPFDGHGLLRGTRLAGAEIFVMPGPMEAGHRVATAIRALSAWWDGG